MHDVRAMCFNRLYAHREYGAHFFVALSFCQELQHFSFSRGQATQRTSDLAAALFAFQVVADDDLGNFRRKKGFVLP